ncbi:zonular occludens toxin domain-containing protein [Acinetobacter bereziniae]|uniref:zonular occludens toxin domain-containing protein n=2 Tax=Moraxellaceae TaxID=468 RepID=UPI001908488D|nr:zonular occludens toxin domain-containing protein [Acinetobacter bereziniae]QQC82489.1 hypothetical protein I9192_10705 [Acinetobacter bereziniae]QQC82518.1 hypothetical protein I9192_10865 [Acinetobacter bereziniae]QQC82527.1 hypothetical protein I9192_10915 [Acinetobacter bereziniae]QQC82536.1 hypothetical protein I9192_10965 [Acinetobacter bereziniae]UUN95632.1 zonular occludens toxin domain-containing protein [Acinetobacter bereziniae]
MSIAGGQFRLTCGQIGAGKSYLYVKQVEEEAKRSGKYQYIYSNIRAHAELAEGVTLLPDSWEDCEPDSLIIIDEVQMHEKFSKHFSNRRDGEIAGLTMIRHKRQDIWMISPNPALVNSDVRNLVNQYFWLEPVGKKTTKCFCFDKVYNNVTKTVKNNAYDEFTYSIDEKFYKLYKSTIDGKASGRNFNLNIKLISFIVGLVIVCLIIAGLFAYLSKDTKSKVDQLQNSETQNKSQDKSKQNKNDLGILPTTPELTSEECRKGINVDKPECIKYFNTLTENRMSVGDLNVEYDPNKPYDQEDIQKVVSKTYQVTAKPVFSGCMKNGNKYYAYTQQGTKLDVSQSDCRNMIENGERPFNYFANNNSNFSNTNAVMGSNVQSIEQPTQQQPTIANNVVEPHLQAKTIN